MQGVAFHEFYDPLSGTAGQAGQCQYPCGFETAPLVKIQPGQAGQDWTRGNEAPRLPRSEKTKRGTLKCLLLLALPRLPRLPREKT
jgi:hypothetical protein